MRDEVVTDLDREIQRVLVVDPSPEFEARVRMRLSEEPFQYRLGIGWLVSGATALMAVAVLALFVSSRDEAVTRAIDPVAPPAPEVAVAEPAAPPAAEQPAAVVPPSPNRTESAGLKGAPYAAVLVPAAEREAMRRFLRTVAENGLSYSVVPDGQGDAPLSVPEIAIEPILIEPIDSTAE
jgi:hypothetical protein